VLIVGRMDIGFADCLQQRLAIVTELESCVALVVDDLTFFCGSYGLRAGYMCCNTVLDRVR
jgi:hypothetical protein